MQEDALCEKNHCVSVSFLRPKIFPSTLVVFYTFILIKSFMKFKIEKKRTTTQCRPNNPAMVLLHSILAAVWNFRDVSSHRSQDQRFIN